MVGSLSVDLTSGRFGNLTVKALIGGTSESPTWKVRCACGVELIESHHNLLSGNATSCKECKEKSSIYA